jgi:hypothetical protein
MGARRNRDAVKRRRTGSSPGGAPEPVSDDVPADRAAEELLAEAASRLLTEMARATSRVRGCAAGLRRFQRSEYGDGACGSFRDAK